MTIKKAIELYKSGELEPALRILSSIKAEHLSSAKYWKIYGTLLELAQRRQEAVKALEASLKLNPDDVDVNTNLSAVFLALSNPQDGLHYAKRALKLDPNALNAKLNLANSLRDLKRFDEAKIVYKDLKTNRYKKYELDLNLGVLYGKLDDSDKAISIYKKILQDKQHKKDATVLCNLGTQYLKINELEKAEFYLERACRSTQPELRAFNNLAVTKRLLNKNRQAIELLNKALKIFNKHTDIYTNLGNNYSDLGMLKEAENAFKQALDFQKINLTAIKNLIVIYRRGKRYKEILNLASSIKSPDELILNEVAQSCVHLGDYKKAEKLFREAIAKNNNARAALINFAALKTDFGEYDISEKLLLRALEQDNKDYVVLSNLGYVYYKQGSLEQAEKYTKKALEQKPNHVNSLVNLANIKTAFGEIPDAIDVLASVVEYDSDPKFLSNYIFMQYYDNSNSDLIFQKTMEIGARISSASKFKFKTWGETKRNKIRIGFMSGDFISHPVGFFLQGLFQSIDQTQFQLIVFSNYAKIDSVTNQLKSHADQWYQIEHLSDDSCAELIHKENIDLLIDLSGHTARNRLGVLTYKPAKNQATWLGFFGSTGLPEVGYVIADDITITKEEERYYVENVVRLPNCYLNLMMPEAVKVRTSLPCDINGFITFGSQNNLTKMTDEVVSVWSDILLAVPSSRLLLRSSQLSSERGLDQTRHRFAKMGIAAERLILHGQSLREQVLETYLGIDIALDTFPYPGGTTTLEALVMNTPVVTLKGRGFLGKIGASILTTAGLNKNIAATKKDYTEIAIRLANNVNALSECQRRLKSYLTNTTLLDSVLFAKEFENLVREIVEKNE